MPRVDGPSGVGRSAAGKTVHGWYRPHGCIERSHTPLRRGHWPGSWLGVGQRASANGPDPGLRGAAPAALDVARVSMKRPREEGDSAPKAFGNCNTYIQILGTVTGDSCPSILIVTEAARYLFNAGDGLQVVLCQAVIFNAN